MLSWRAATICRLSAEQDEILDEIEKFVTGVRFAGEYDRVLATVYECADRRLRGRRAQAKQERLERHS